MRSADLDPELLCHGGASPALPPGRGTHHHRNEEKALAGRNTGMKVRGQEAAHVGPMSPESAGLNLAGGRRP